MPQCFACSPTMSYIPLAFIAAAGTCCLGYGNMRRWSWGWYPYQVHPITCGTHGIQWTAVTLSDKLYVGFASVPTTSLLWEVILVLWVNPTCTVGIQIKVVWVGWSSAECNFAVWRFTQPRRLSCKHTCWNNYLSFMKDGHFGSCINWWSVNQFHHAVIKQHMPTKAQL